MSTHYETSLQQGLDRIREKVAEMGKLCERALRDALRALQERNRQLAYSVIVRDQRVDELEKEIDRLCLEFLVRQQPAGTPLREAYSTIRINLELERVGDYAESIARQVIKLAGNPTPIPLDRFAEVAERSIQSLHDATQAYLKQDTTLARDGVHLEEVVDVLKNRLNADLVQLFRDSKIPLEVLHPLMTIARRLERVSDQARSICQEVLYICTGEDTKHPGSNVYRILFVDEHNASLSLMAAAMANSLHAPGFIFDSAGSDPRPSDRVTVEFMRAQGLDVSRMAPKAISQVPHLNKQDVIAALGPDVKRLFPNPPRNQVFLDWNVPDPSTAHGSPADVQKAYEEAYRFLRAQIHDLVEGIVGNNAEQPAT